MRKAKHCMLASEALSVYRIVDLAANGVGQTAVGNTPLNSEGGLAIIYTHQHIPSAVLTPHALDMCSADPHLKQIPATQEPESGSGQSWTKWPCFLHWKHTWIRLDRYFPDSKGHQTLCLCLLSLLASICFFRLSSSRWDSGINESFDLLRCAREALLPLSDLSMLVDEAWDTAPLWVSTVLLLPQGSSPKCWTKSPPKGCSLLSRVFFFFFLMFKFLPPTSDNDSRERVAESVSLAFNFLAVTNFLGIFLDRVSANFFFLVSFRSPFSTFLTLAEEGLLELESAPVSWGIILGSWVNNRKESI